MNYTKTLKNYYTGDNVNSVNIVSNLNYLFVFNYEIYNNLIKTLFDNYLNSKNGIRTDISSIFTQDSSDIPVPDIYNTILSKFNYYYYINEVSSDKFSDSKYTTRIDNNFRFNIAPPFPNNNNIKYSG